MAMLPNRRFHPTVKALGQIATRYGALPIVRLRNHDAAGPRDYRRAITWMSMFVALRISLFTNDPRIISCQRVRMRLADDDLRHVLLVREREDPVHRRCRRRTTSNVPPSS